MDSFAALIKKTKVDRVKKRKRVGADPQSFVRRGEFRRIDEEDYDAEEEQRRRKLAKEHVTKEGWHAKVKHQKDRYKCELSGDSIERFSTDKEHLSSNKEQTASETAELRSHSSLTTDEVIRQLREHGEPATLFGETEELRRKRCVQVCDAKKNRPDNSDLALPVSHRGRNIFLDNAYEALSDDEEKKDKSKSAPSKDYSSNGATVSRKYRTPEMRCYKFFKKMLKEWARSLADRSDAEKRSVKGKVATKTQKQCKDYMRPFFKMCKKKQVSATILDKVVAMVKHCEEREYVKAHSVYMDLAIGRSAWPIGATSVGIHERAARERIQTNKVAHVMNDEGARKYVTSMKRLMSFCQANYPAEGPSKMVLH